MPKGSDESQVLCTLAEHDAILSFMAEQLSKIEGSIATMDDRLGRKIDSSHQCLLGRIDRLDERMRAVEQRSAVYGTTAGAIVSAMITVGIRLLLGRNH